MATKSISARRSRRLSAEEMALIRAALKADGLPNYPERIIAAPEAAELKPAPPASGK